MIKSFLKDPNLHFTDPSAYHSSEKIIEKLAYFRNLSRAGFSQMTKNDLDKLGENIFEFFRTIICATRPVDSQMSSLYRASVVKSITGNNNQLLTKISQLTAPPASIVKLGRANLNGFPTFYASLDFDSSVLEVLQDEGDYVMVSEWKIKTGKELTCHVVCHPDIKLKNPIWQRQVDRMLDEFRRFPSGSAKAVMEILKFVAEEFTKQVKRENRSDYLASAIFSSLLLTTNARDKSNSLDALIYPGAKDLSGPLNFAIDNSTVHLKMDLVALHLVKVNKIIRSASNPDIVEGFDGGLLLNIPSKFDLKTDRILYG